MDAARKDPIVRNESKPSHYGTYRSSIFGAVLTGPATGEAEEAEGAAGAAPAGRTTLTAAFLRLILAVLVAGWTARLLRASWKPKPEGSRGAFGGARFMAMSA